MAHHFDMLNFGGLYLLVPLSSGYLLDLPFTGWDPIVTNEGKGWDPRSPKKPWKVVILLGSEEGVDPSYGSEIILLVSFIYCCLNPNF